MTIHDSEADVAYALRLQKLEFRFNELRRWFRRLRDENEDLRNEIGRLKVKLSL